MFVLHTSDNLEWTEKDHKPVTVRAIRVQDDESHTYMIPADEVWEVPSISGTDIPGPMGSPAYKSFTTPSEHVGRLLMRKAKFHGLVEVHAIRKDNSIVFDVEGAKKASTVARTQAEDAMVQAYVKTAKEDELAKLPIRPPSAPIVRVLQQRGLDLKRDFGIQPVGYTVSEGAKQRDREMAKLQDENKSLHSEMAEMKEMLAMILEDKEKTAKRKTEKTAQ